MLWPGAARAMLCPVRTVHRREAGPLRRAVGAAAVLLVLGLLLVSHMSAPSPSALTMGVTSRPITVDGVTRPAVPSHPKSSGPPTQSGRATAGALAQSVGVGPSAAKARATGSWGSWGPPSAWARHMGRYVAVVGLLCVWGWGGRPGPRWRMLRTTATGKGKGLQAMAAQGPASVDASGMSSEEAVEYYCGVNLPTLLAMYGMEKMKGTIAYLEELGVDVTKVVNRSPQVFGYSMENMKGTVAYLEELGVDVTKVVNRHPAVFGLSMENMKGTVAYLEELGVDVTKVVNRHPAVFGLSMENIKGTVAYLEELGVDVTKVVNRLPAVFGYSMENMKGTVAYLEELGVDVTKVMNRLPAVFGLSMET